MATYLQRIGVVSTAGMAVIRRAGSTGLLLALLVACTSVGRAQQAQVAYAPVEGGRLEYIASGPAGGEPVLLLHGSGLADSFALVAVESALRDYRLIRVHRRGYAGSSEVVGGSFSMAQQAADAFALMDALGIDKAHVVGHSYGAVIAQQMAMDAPQRIHSLVAVDIPAPGVQPELPPPAGDPVALLQAGNREAAVGAFFSMVLDDWRRDFSSVPGGVEQASEDIDTVLYIEAPAMEAFRGDPSAITMPFLSIWGEESHLYLDGSQDMVAEIVPQAEFSVVTDTDHGLVAQKPADVASAMATFFARHPM